MKFPYLRKGQIVESARELIMRPLSSEPSLAQTLHPTKTAGDPRTHQLVTKSFCRERTESGRWRGGGEGRKSGEGRSTMQGELFVLIRRRR